MAFLNSQQNNSVLKNNNYISKTFSIIWTTEKFENINFVLDKLRFYFLLKKKQITPDNFLYCFSYVCDYTSLS